MEKYQKAHLAENTWNTTNIYVRKALNPFTVGWVGCGPFVFISDVYTLYCPGLFFKSQVETSVTDPDPHCLGLPDPNTDLDPVYSDRIRKTGTGSATLHWWKHDNDIKSKT